MEKAPIAAVHSEASVGRPVDEATNAEGQQGTYGCACKDRDAGWCASLRYGSWHRKAGGAVPVPPMGDDDEYDA